MGPLFLRRASVWIVSSVCSKGSFVGGHCEEEEEKHSFPKGCLCFQLFSQARETGCRSPTTSAAPPQLHAFILSLHNSWKSLFSLSIAGPCAQQLNYPQDFRVSATQTMDQNNFVIIAYSRKATCLYLYGHERQLSINLSIMCMFSGH